MGKYSDFVRKPRDFYPTPYHAFEPLIPHLPAGPFTFAEPCAGDFRLAGHIEGSTMGRCVWASDIEPKHERVVQADAFELWKGQMNYPTLIITNPPWDRRILKPLIPYLSHYAPTWLLLYADWVHTKQASEFSHLLEKVVSVGRVSWEENGQTGKENAIWVLYSTKVRWNQPTEFYGR